MLKDSPVHNYVLLLLQIWSLNALCAPLYEAFKQGKLLRRLATPPEIYWHFYCDFGVAALFMLHLLLWAHEINQPTGLYAYVLGYLYAWTVMAVYWARIRYTAKPTNTPDDHS